MMKRRKHDSMDNLDAPFAEDSRLFMCNNPLLPVLVEKCLKRYTSEATPFPDFRKLRSYFSSPRVQDMFCEGDLSFAGTRVGRSYLDHCTNLADNKQPTVATTIASWANNASQFTTIVNPTHKSDFTIIQIWPYYPGLLTELQLKVAVLLSFTDYELEDPRLGIAVDEIARTIGFSMPD